MRQESLEKLLRTCSTTANWAHARTGEGPTPDQVRQKTYEKLLFTRATSLLTGPRLSILLGVRFGQLSVRLTPTFLKPAMERLIVITVKIPIWVYTVRVRLGSEGCCLCP